MVKLIFSKSMCCALFMALSGSSLADIVVVGGIDIPTLSKQQAKQIFLKKINVLPNGTRVIPIDLTDSHSIKWDFYKSVAGKKPAQLHSYWSRALFSGGGKPPEQVASAAELKRRLLNDSGVIGYIDEKDIGLDMKVLLRITI